MRLGILSCHQSYKQIIGENTSQNKSINVLVVYDQKHRYAVCICLFSRSGNLLVDCDLKNLQLLPIDDESWREVFLLFVEKWSHHMSYDKELKENVMKFLSYVKIILSKLADNVRKIYFAQLGT